MPRTPDPTSAPASSAAPKLPADMPPDWRYEQTVAEIESIITRIEMGELDLADVFDQFNRAVEYLRQCEVYLSAHQQQMDLLIETLVDSDA